MDTIDLGPIKVIPGENNSIFPYCTSILIEGEARILIDPGCGERTLQEIKAKGKVDRVINTHYHFDHIRGNHLFSESEIYINQTESRGFRNLAEITKMLGMVEVYGDEWASEWVDSVTSGTRSPTPYSPSGDHRWYLSTRRLDGIYKGGDTLEFGEVKVEVLPTPGHSQGNCCLFFPEQRAVYTGDFDLTKFGPWYGGSDGDITSFVRSAIALLGLEADHFITGHEVGILGLDEFLSRMTEFLDVIDRRDRMIKDLLEKGSGLEEIVSQGILYNPEYHVDPWIYMWEKLSIKHHIRRLLDLDMLDLPAETREELAQEVKKPGFAQNWYDERYDE